MSVTVVTIPISMRFACDGPRWAWASPSLHRHGGRHEGNGLDRRFSRRRDGDDACDDDLWAFSKGGDRAHVAVEEITSLEEITQDLGLDLWQSLL
jgi:hypothetical protein